MAKRVNTMKATNTKKTNNQQTIKPQNIGYSILFFAFGILLFFLVLLKGENLWFLMHELLWGMFGFSGFLLPFFILFVSFSISFLNKMQNLKAKLWLSLVFILEVSTCIFIFQAQSEFLEKNYFACLMELYKYGLSYKGAGMLSGVFGYFLIFLLGKTGAKILISLGIFVVTMFLSGATLSGIWILILKPFAFLKNKIHTQSERKRKFELPQHPVSSATPKMDPGNKKEMVFDEKEFNEKIQSKFCSKEKAIKPGINRENTSEYAFPSPDLLECSVEQNGQSITKELQSSAQMLVQTLQNFGVKAKIIDISRGPAVTRYELQPAAGVKISKITNLADDIALNLAAFGVRIEAPIPGKAALGIEIPNKIVNIVRMKELVESKEFLQQKSNLSVILGKDIAGNVTVADLAKMPHLLIAGSTGSGKSVCINSFIISLIYKSTPQDVRLLLVDPKVVELGIYNGIPHLLVPVVTDPQKAAGTLNWAVTEMLKRYKIFAENNVRDLASYNNFAEKFNQSVKKSEEHKPKMPQIVIIIDELADLMMAAPNEVEDAICRLAQMARAAGMHLVIATQRPSVDVITGVIKANIPSRIALAVSSQIDSRTILDSAGAEKLLGRGDMLFSPLGSAKPKRVQGCYVTEEEIEKVLETIKQNGEQQYDEKVIRDIEINSVVETKSKDKHNNEEDSLFYEALECIVSTGQASTSYLQRKLKIGYARAGRIMDHMEERGFVGPQDGSKTRQILLETYQIREIIARNNQ